MVTGMRVSITIHFPLLSKIHKYHLRNYYF
nr:MAG TPA: kinase [Caudoviricetes sp.]